MGILYSRQRKTELRAYADSIYAEDLDDKKSIAAYVVLLGTGAVSWTSEKQPVMSLSTTEAKFILTAQYACQAVWLRRMTKLHQTQNKFKPILCDNNSTIQPSKIMFCIYRSKHIDVRIYYLHDMVKNGEVELFLCNTAYEVEDFPAAKRMDGNV